jgi:hypothetical protein
MDQELYDKARSEVDMWPAMAQGLAFEGAEKYPELFEKVPNLSDIPDGFFSTYLDPVQGDKLVHLGAFYGGSKLTMAGMDYLGDDVSDEALMAGAFIATTMVGSGMEFTDVYFDMADMAANYAGWYLASESYLEEGPTRKMADFIRSEDGEDPYSLPEDYQEMLEDRLEPLGKM